MYILSTKQYASCNKPKQYASANTSRLYLDKER